MARLLIISLVVVIILGVGGTLIIASLPIAPPQHQQSLKVAHE